MIHIPNFIDSTYLKTPEQSGLSEAQTRKKVEELLKEAIEYGFFAVMIRPRYVKFAKDFLQNHHSDIKVGTVISFPQGTNSLQEKLNEAQQAIANGADELDFVINYSAYIKDDKELVKQEVLACTQLCFENKKVAKWIIEIAALTDEQIKHICTDIKSWITRNFPENFWKNVFIKSSTGFYPTIDGKPNGATFEGIKIMLEYGSPLPIKAAGGVKTKEDALKMIAMGVQRIGTSSALALISDVSAEKNAY